MILCVCPNPALDVTYHVPNAGPGASHTVSRSTRQAGGKATNVARVLAALDEPVRLLAPLGGPAGEEFARLADAGELGLDSVALGENTRTTVGLSDGTIFNETGPRISRQEWAALVTAVADLARSATVVVLAGSLPPGAGYRELVEAGRAAGALTVLDAAGPALHDALKVHPDVVTPNLREACAALGTPGLDWNEAAAQLVAGGAGAAVVSDGARGLLLRHDGATFEAAPPDSVDGNPTGAGDAVSAAIALGLARHRDWPDIVGDAVALAMAAVACDTAGHIDPSVYVSARPRVHVHQS